MHRLKEENINEGEMTGVTKICPNSLFNSGLLNAYWSLESILSPHIQGEHTLNWSYRSSKLLTLSSCLQPVRLAGGNRTTGSEETQ